MPSLLRTPPLRTQHALQRPRNLPPMTHALLLAGIATDPALVEKGIKSVPAITAPGLAIDGTDRFRDFEAGLVVDVALGV